MLCQSNQRWILNANYSQYRNTHSYTHTGCQRQTCRGLKPPIKTNPIGGWTSARKKKYFREWNNINFWPAARMMMCYNIKLGNLFHFAKTFLLGFHWSSGFQSRVRLQLVTLEPPLVVHRGITFPTGLVGLWVVLYTAVLQYIHTGSVCDGDGGSEVLIYFILF